MFIKLMRKTENMLNMSMQIHHSYHSLSIHNSQTDANNFMLIQPYFLLGLQPWTKNVMGSQVKGGPSFILLQGHSDA